MELPVGNIVAAVATVISVVIANRLSSSQSGQAKLWDFRRLAYGVIVSELASVERIRAVADEYMAEGPHGYSESDARDRHNEQVAAHMKILRQRFSDDITLFEVFTADLASGPPDEDYPDEEERFSEAVRKHRPLLLAQARKEVAARRQLWRRS